MKLVVSPSIKKLNDSAKNLREIKTILTNFSSFANYRAIYLDLYYQGVAREILDIAWLQIV